MTHLPERIMTIEQFFSRVTSSADPVFLFALPFYYSDFSPEIQSFAETHPHLKIYGITHEDSREVLEYLSGRLGVPTMTEFMLWRDGNKVVEFSREQVSDLMTILRAMGVLKM